MIESTFCDPASFDILNIAKDFALVILGFVLALIPNYLQRRRRLRAHWSALGAEAELCAQFAMTYLTAGVEAPLYRLPEAAFTTSFPALLSDAGVKGEEVTGLESFWCLVQDINRGLDNAHDAVRQSNSNQLAAEAGRLKLKCTKLLEDKSDAEARITVVRKILTRHAG